MGLQLCTFFLGLLLLLGWGTTQTPVSSEKTSTEEEQWPKLVILNNLTFSCNLKMLGSNASSTSVHTLRPSDLKFVASIGMKEILPAQSTVSVMEKLNRIEEVFQEVSLGVGAVLSDIIGYFNPAILRSECTPRRNVTPWPGAKHLCTQATELVRSMKENPELDFENEWKLINVFIHHAHKCYLCPVARQKSFVASALNNLAKTLDYLHQEVPRAFLNLVDLTEVLEFSALSEMETQGSDNTESCGCSEETLLPKDVALWAYQEAWERVLASSKYNQEDSFALVFQPFFYETDQSPLLKEQSLQDLALMGMHLWNSMLEPAGQKGRPYRAREKRLVKCPQKEHPYLFTYGNSNYQPWLPKYYVAHKVLEASTPNFTSSITWPSSTSTNPTTSFSSTQTTPTTSSTSTLTIPTTSSNSILTTPTTSSSSTQTTPTTSSTSTLTIPTTSSTSTLTIPTTSSTSTLTVPTTSSNSTLTVSTTSFTSTLTIPTTSSTSTLTIPTTSSTSTLTVPTTSSNSTLTVPTTSSNSTLTVPTTSSNSILTTPTTSSTSTLTIPTTSSTSTLTIPTTSSTSTLTIPTTSSNSTLTVPTTSSNSILTTPTTSSTSTLTIPTTSSTSTLTIPTTSSTSTLTIPTTSSTSTLTIPTTSSTSTLTIPTTSSTSTLTVPTTSSTSTLTVPTTSSNSTLTVPTTSSNSTLTVPTTSSNSTLTVPTTSSNSTLTTPTTSSTSTLTTPTTSSTSTLTIPTTSSTSTLTIPTTSSTSTLTIPTTSSNSTLTTLTTSSTSTLTIPTTSSNSTLTVPTTSSNSTLTTPTTSSTSTLTTPTTSSTSTLTIPTTSSTSTLTIPTTSSTSTLTIPTTSSNPTLTIPTTSSNSTLTIPTTSSTSTLTIPTTSSTSTLTIPTTSSTSTLTIPTTSSTSTLTVPTTSSNSTLTVLTTSSNSILTTPTTSSTSTLTIPTTSSTSTLTIPTTSSTSTLTIPTTSSTSTLTIPTTSSNSTLTIPTTSSNSTLTTLTTSSNSILTTLSTSSNSTSTTLITSSSSTSTTLNTSSSSTLTTPITSSNSILTTLSTSFSSISTTLNTSSSSTSTTLNTSSSSTLTTPITSSNSILTTLSTSFSSISTTLNTSSSSTSTTLNTSSSSTLTTPITSSNSILTTLSTSFSSISTTLNTSSSSTLTILTTSSSSKSNTVSTFSSSTLTTLTTSSSVQSEVSIDNCPARAPSSSNPQSVHSLRPADIKVVAAIGDAFTAGSGAKSSLRYISDVFTEYRGVSWSIGGDANLKTVVTLPNILRRFNSKLKGFSTGSGNQNSDGAKLNQAVVGALSRDMPNQVREVIRKMKRNKKINYEKDWKLLTVFIGVTDLCLACTQKPRLTPEGFRHNVQVTLDILHAEVPRMFVNMVLPLDITGLKDVGWRKTNKPCPLLYQKKSCPCVFQFDDDWETDDEAVEENKKYQELIKELLETGRYDTREDFTVVLQPFLEQLRVPLAKTGLIDVSYLAPDCFLFSQKTHGKAASALWKNMLEPVGQKTKKHIFASKIVFACPTELQPFLFTSKNSLENYGSKVFCIDIFPSFTTPRTVYTLKPADIQIVAAMGDFVIAGTGIGAEPGKVDDLATEYRGLSFSAGGDNNLTKVTTLPNIFRIFNGNLKGFAVSTGDAQSQNSGLNQAVSSAKAKDLLRQAQTLVEIMENDKKIDFFNDWKIITVMIGNNDLCDFCHDVNKHSGDQFLYHVRNGLDYLQAEVPRALVNLVDFIDPYVQRQVFMTNPDVCSLNQSSVSCNCILSPKMSFSELLNVENMARIYKNNLYNLVASGRYNIREDFTVVLQPAFSKIQIPVLKNGSLDTSFFAPDCFHPNQKFHTQLARALWSNMLQPLGRKKDFLNVGYPVTLGCPEDHQDFSPFLRTIHRSKYKYQPLVEQNWGSDFICSHTKPSHKIPTSVHKLRPADIRVVAALGDWITTALGVRPDNQKEVLSWNGLSWSIGGDKTLEKQTTLPNILRNFNPEIVGYSSGTWRELTGLNVAQEEARARHLPTQAMNLIKQMKSNPKINMSSDWKLITIFIGINDLCDFCTNKDPKITENIIQNITVTLDIFFKELPRVFINLVEIMQLFPMYQNQGGKCANSTVPRIHCPCFTVSKERFQNKKLRKLNMELQSAVFNLSLNTLYQTRKDFVVVTQPFFRNSVFPRNKKGEIDSTFFSEDCFHFSSRGHDEMAIALWNNMLEPVGHKSTYHDFEKNRKKLRCPSTVHPYLFTQANSTLGVKAQLLFRVALALFFLPLIFFLTVKLLKWLGNKRFSKRVQAEEPETSMMDSEVREEETMVSGAAAETKV